MTRPTLARIDLDALRHNARIAHALAPKSQLLAVVKANAYGHGALAVARALTESADAFAVACLEEAAALRAGGITHPILLLQGVFAPSELPAACELDVWLSIDNIRQIDWLGQAALPAPLRCWLKIDTGMHRLGIEPASAPDAHARLAACRNRAGEIVLTTHFAAADDPASDSTARQLAVFNAIDLPGPRSAANSAGVLAWPTAHFDWVRPGYMLYGHSPLPAGADSAAADLQPVMSFESAVTAIHDLPPGAAVGYGGTWVASRPSRIATISAGYGDGYPRTARNGTPVLVGGRRAPLAGRVSMDMLTVDVTDLPEIGPGAPVELWGRNLPLAEVASCAGTIGYELTTRMPSRTPRVAHGPGPGK